jgi:hypothetical protein
MKSSAELIAESKSESVIKKKKEASSSIYCYYKNNKSELYTNDVRSKKEFEDYCGENKNSLKQYYVCYNSLNKNEVIYAVDSLLHVIDYKATIFLVLDSNKNRMKDIDPISSIEFNFDKIANFYLLTKLNSLSKSLVLSSDPVKYLSVIKKIMSEYGAKDFKTIKKFIAHISIIAQTKISESFTFKITKENYDEELFAVISDTLLRSSIIGDNYKYVFCGIDNYFYNHLVTNTYKQTYGENVNYYTDKEVLILQKLLISLFPVNDLNLIEENIKKFENITLN